MPMLKCMDLHFWLHWFDLSRPALKGNAVLKNIYIPMDLCVLSERSITTSAHGCRDLGKTLRFVLFE